MNKHIEKLEKVEMCKYCKKDKEIAKGYTICWDCLIELDINLKDYKRYKVNKKYGY